MFDSGSGLADAAAVADAVSRGHRALIDAEARLLDLAARWADCHPGDLTDRGGVPGREDGRVVGGAGTPLVATFSLAELGALMGTT